MQVQLILHNLTGIGAKETLMWLTHNARIPMEIIVAIVDGLEKRLTLYLNRYVSIKQILKYYLLTRPARMMHVKWIFVESCMPLSLGQGSPRTYSSSACVRLRIVRLVTGKPKLCKR